MAFTMRHGRDRFGLLRIGTQPKDEHVAVFVRYVDLVVDDQWRRTDCRAIASWLQYRWPVLASRQ